MLMQQSPAQIRLAEQPQSEALTEAARRQRAHQRQEELSQQQEQLNAQAVLQQREMDAQQRALDAQQAALLAEQACIRAEWRALEHVRVRSRAGRDADSGSAPSQGGARRGGGSSGGGGGSGGGGSLDGSGGSGGGGSGGGDGDGGGGSTSGATVSHYGNDNSARRASVAAAPAAEVDLAGFDTSGYAIMRVAVTLNEKQFPKTKVDQGNVSALTSLQKQLPGKFRSAALAFRQKQQPLWPALCNADDFGCECFNTAVYSIVSCMANGGGDHPRLGTLARQASSWEMQGGEQGLRDGALLSWLFTKIAKFLKIAEPTSVAANLMNWSLRQGLALKLFPGGGGRTSQDAPRGVNTRQSSLADQRAQCAGCASADTIMAAVTWQAAAAVESARPARPRLQQLLNSSSSSSRSWLQQLCHSGGSNHMKFQLQRRQLAPNLYRLRNRALQRQRCPRPLQRTLLLWRRRRAPHTQQHQHHGALPQQQRSRYPLLRAQVATCGSPPLPSYRHLHQRRTGELRLGAARLRTRRGAHAAPAQEAYAIMGGWRRAPAVREWRQQQQLAPAVREAQQQQQLVCAARTFSWQRLRQRLRGSSCAAQRARRNLHPHSICAGMPPCA
ncbi:hypothetical protein JKP88DRAFT_253788 [Tribonema minus]|uniref:Uncharacterized protein n=1 Tax=Tribonema minus TaxID=303371 RepID=A0A836CLJ8_9STRA|nr:hypothetical protein JKP88DRAFT_253788 [Tribonema minus]